MLNEIELKLVLDISFQKYTAYFCCNIKENLSPVPEMADTVLQGMGYQLVETLDEFVLHKVSRTIFEVCFELLLCQAELDRVMAVLDYASERFGLSDKEAIRLWEQYVQKERSVWNVKDCQRFIRKHAEENLASSIHLNRSKERQDTAGWSHSKTGDLVPMERMNTGKDLNGRRVGGFPSSGIRDSEHEWMYAESGSKKSNEAESWHKMERGMTDDGEGSGMVHRCQELIQERLIMRDSQLGRGVPTLAGKVTDSSKKRSSNSEKPSSSLVDEINDRTVRIGSGGSAVIFKPPTGDPLSILTLDASKEEIKRGTSRDRNIQKYDFKREGMIKPEKKCKAGKHFDINEITLNDGDLLSEATSQKSSVCQPPSLGYNASQYNYRNDDDNDGERLIKIQADKDNKGGYGSDADPSWIRNCRPDGGQDSKGGYRPNSEPSWTREYRSQEGQDSKGGYWPNSEPSWTREYRSQEGQDSKGGYRPNSEPSWTREYRSQEGQDSKGGYRPNSEPSWTREYRSQEGQDSKEVHKSQAVSRLYEECYQEGIYESSIGTHRKVTANDLLSSIPHSERVDDITSTAADVMKKRCKTNLNPTEKTRSFNGSRGFNVKIHTPSIYEMHDNFSERENVEKQDRIPDARKLPSLTPTECDLP